MQTSTARARIVVLALSAAAAVLAGCSSATTSGPAKTAAAPRTATSSTVAALPAAPAESVAPTTQARSTAVTGTNPCTHNSARRFVRVSLKSQHLWMCAAHTLAYSTPITSGMAGAYTGTPTGHFHIQGRDRNTVLTLNTGRQYDVKYWIPFDAPLFGFHDSSWQSFPYGSAKYRTDGSHGCVHMPLKAIAFLYRWADIGTSVTIA